MSTFNVELKKVVDDSYEIEIGFDLQQKLITDILWEKLFLSPGFSARYSFSPLCLFAVLQQ